MNYFFYQAMQIANCKLQRAETEIITLPFVLTIISNNYPAAQMMSFTNNTPFLLCIFLYSISRCSALNSCGTFNGYTAVFFLCDGQTISSTGDVKFQLGFFTPKGSLNKNRYVGIWYLTDPETVVWVANRDKPLPEKSTGSFGLPNNNGNLQLFDEKGNSYFSTDLESSESLRKVSLLESGNLVLTEESGKVLWQSFNNPTDTFLPGMKMGGNIKLTSWNSGEDPSSGNYRFKEGEEGAHKIGYVIMNGTVINWKSEAESGIFGSTTNNEMNVMAGYLLDNYNPMRANSTHLVNTDFNKTRLVISWWGEIQYFKLNKDNKTWTKIWSEPQTRCSVYNICGKFGTCRSDKENSCECLWGFKPEVPEKWESGDYSGGCIRESPLCAGGNYTLLFLNVINMDRQDNDYDDNAKDEVMCQQSCNTTCLCQAYSFRYSRSRDSNGSGCYIWRSDLANIQVDYDTNELPNIAIKVANLTTVAAAGVPNASQGTDAQNNATQVTHARNKSLSGPVVIIIVTSSVVALVLLICCLSYIYHRKMVAKNEESRKGITENTVGGSNPRQLSEEEKGNIDVPFFELKIILAATDSFSDANKLGEGGFGPVYKGTFPGGQEIAVKRLSVHSMQGMEELKNEVVLIARLQHRNLVRLLGYCIEGNENILLYEYMPNKSLDAFIFDERLCVLLNWEKRFEIIMGIARGLLYLHQDSRLRIIHRDLKASNVLLDEDMNPKISDFGLARIVGGRDTAANTNRIVGTYGYMSPEYALEGLFSIKSDVFSFGVVMLEIISGKKNTGFYRSLHDLNLLGYAWRLWKEGNALGIMDETIAECCNKNEVLKCITIALLCIQEDPSDRPNMSNIVIMLGSTDIENTRSPKRPAFVTRTNEKILSNKELTLSHHEILSTNEVTLSIVKPR